MSILQTLKTFFDKTPDIKPYTHYQKGRFRYITEFKNGYALALISRFDSIKNRYMNDIFYIAIVNENYDTVMQTSYYSYDNWYNGCLIAFTDSFAVLLDSDLKEIPNIRYNWIGIINNYLEVNKKNEDLIKYGLLDENFELMLPEIYSSITSISKSCFFCKGETNIAFNAVTKQTFELRDVSFIIPEDINGWYKFYNINYLYGYLDNNFKIVIQPKYDCLGDFCTNGLAPFERDGIIGFVDRTGKEFIQ